jgi:hypothetical protein
MADKNEFASPLDAWRRRRHEQYKAEKFHAAQHNDDPNAKARRQTKSLYGIAGVVCCLVVWIVYHAYHTGIDLTPHDIATYM